MSTSVSVNSKTKRKLKLQVSISVDGFVSAPNNETEWLTCEEDCLKYIHNLAESVDTILMGRKMVDEFISHWTKRMNNPDDHWNAFAKRMIETPKIVFTKTLNESRWANTDISKGDIKEEITKLKSKDGKDMLVYGGASFDSSLIKENLVDEFYLLVNPIIFGNGKTIFKDLKEIQKLKLVESKVFDCGLVLQHYELHKN